LSDPVETQVIIEDNDRRLLGMLYTPADDADRAVVFCDPLFEERKSSQRVMVEMARALCRAGSAVLRFDCRGCGDSPGEFPDYAPPDWLDDVAAAVRFLRTSAPAPRLGLLGLRFGASLALQSAVHGASPGVDFLILWEPVVNGRDYLEQELRKKLVKEMITFGRSRGTRDALTHALEKNESIDFDGYLISPRLYTALCGTHLLEPAARFLGNVLLVHVSAGERPSKDLSALREAFATAGAETAFRVIKDPPFWNLIGLTDCAALLQETQAWMQTAGRLMERV
jgi:exosortase A-associated hydrolase 2